MDSKKPCRIRVFLMVGGTWIEHVTSSVSRKRSPTELTARCARRRAGFLPRRVPPRKA